jgi:peptidyl-prolyl cis-trans isomerase C
MGHTLRHRSQRVPVSKFMKQLLREPLFHFLLIGAVLFTPYYFLQPAGNKAGASKEIRLSLEEISQQVLLFQSQWNREPTTEELGQLMENRVQEEVLYREALALGLDQGDTIVKRRMAQKMQFLAEDVAAAREPTQNELEDWYREHSTQFALPARYSFRHLYFSPDRRGVNARDDAATAKDKLQGQPEDSSVVETLADPFMFQDFYRERSPEFLGKEFGPNFAVAIEQLATGSWQGPVESGLGWHLVFVDGVIAGRVPDFAEVMAEVKTAWLVEQKALAWEKAYKEMRARYTVLLPAPPDEASIEAAPAPPAEDVTPL